MRPIVATVIAFFAVMVAFTMSSMMKDQKQSFRPQDFVVPLPTNAPPTPTSTNTPTPTMTPQQIFYEELKEAAETVGFTYIDIEYEYIGTYYITAYCPSECGYNGSNFPTGWMTASDTICHRADYEDRLYEPTTCAVDPKLHSISGNEYFYIAEFDRVFVAEDTGSAVKGKHLDLFYEDYSDVCSFPTGYYDVYSVKYVEKTFTAGRTGEEE